MSAPSRLRLAAACAAALLAGCSRGPARASLEWTAMGTVARVQVRAADASAAESACAAASAAVRDVFADVERMLDAHDPDSELSRLAALPDAEILARCDARVRQCYAAAFDFARASGGAFNPRWRGPGTMDLGAIAKGFAVDLAGEAALARIGADAPDLLIDLGGNLKAVKGSWYVGMRDPEGPCGVGGAFRLGEGAACATSGEYERGRHIVDGRTGRAPDAPARGVTVVHPASAMEADALSTALFVLGRGRGDEFASARCPGAQVMWLGADGP